MQRAAEPTEGALRRLWRILKKRNDCKNIGLWRFMVQKVNWDASLKCSLRFAEDANESVVTVLKFSFKSHVLKSS